jgi:outer membrane protein assembly factor BamE (lipoprotein component of BamABCDE complex)
VSAVQPGVDNKESVQNTLGRPTFTGTFDQNDWYYVSRRTKNYAFHFPRVNQQTVLHVRFDQAGNVASVERKGLEQVVSIDPMSDKTPTLGRNKSIWDELFGNIGAVGAPGTGQGSGGPNSPN